MYSFFLVLHSITRWLVVVFAILAIGRAFAGTLGHRPWTRLDDRFGLLFTISLDLQVLIGLILYFVLSPMTTSALANFGGAMANPATRFYLVEHSLIMLVAVVLAHIGRSQSKKATQDTTKHRRALIFYTLAFLAILVAIPWPFLSYGRPWIRF